MKKFLMALALVLVCLPTTLFAESYFKVDDTEYELFSDAITAAGNDKTIYLIKDYEDSATFTINADNKVKLDLGGFRLEAIIINNGDLTLTNGTIEKKIASPLQTSVIGDQTYSIPAEVDGIKNTHDAKLTVDNVTFIYGTDLYYYVINNNGGTVDIKNAKFNINSDENTDNFTRCNILHNLEGTINIESSEVVLSNNITFIQNITGVINAKKINITSNNGYNFIDNYDGELTIDESKINLKSDKYQYLDISLNSKVTIKNSEINTEYTGDETDYNFIQFDNYSYDSNEEYKPSELNIINSKINVKNGRIIFAYDKKNENSDTINIINSELTSNYKKGMCISTTKANFNFESGKITCNSALGIMLGKGSVFTMGTNNEEYSKTQAIISLAKGGFDITPNEKDSTTIKLYDGEVIVRDAIGEDFVFPEDISVTKEKIEDGYSYFNTLSITSASDVAPQEDKKEDDVKNPDTGIFIGIGAGLLLIPTIIAVIIRKKFYRV